MSENQEHKRTIIESYDGDPDEVVFFQMPVSDESACETELEEEEGYNEEGLEEIQQMEVGGAEPESPVIEPLESQVPLSSGSIDVNDPHYANYKPDPYYEYGYGTEPKAKRIDEKKENSTLGILSFCTGIASMFMMCCGIQYLLGLTAIISGIWCLCLKGNTKSTKVFAIIGIICGCMPFLAVILSMLWTVFYPIILRGVMYNNYHMGP